MIVGRIFGWLLLAIAALIMIVGRIFGWLLLAIAALLALGGVILAVMGGTVGTVLGQVWYQVHADSLNLTQAITQRYILPALWDPVAIVILNWPLWLAIFVVVLVPAIVGGALVALLRPRAAVAA